MKCFSILIFFYFIIIIGSIEIGGNIYSEKRENKMVKKNKGVNKDKQNSQSFQHLSAFDRSNEKTDEKEKGFHKLVRFVEHKILYVNETTGQLLPNRSHMTNATVQIDISSVDNQHPINSTLSQNNNTDITINKPNGYANTSIIPIHDQYSSYKLSQQKSIIL